MNCKPKVLVEGDHFYISQCKNCKRIGLYFNNLMAGFSKDEFIQFSSAILQLEFNDGQIIFPDRQERIVIQTCHLNIHFTFAEEEFETLKENIAQAKLLIEVGDVISIK